MTDQDQRYANLIQLALALSRAAEGHEAYVAALLAGLLGSASLGRRIIITQAFFLTFSFLLAALLD